MLINFRYNLWQYSYGSSKMKICSLTVVGTGIKVIAQITLEAKANIEQADKVLYLVNTPDLKTWIERQNKNSKSLDGLYHKYPLRIDCYQAITEYVLEETRKGQNVCMVIYGHPTIFAKSGVDAVIQAEKEGIDARILPGISAEDCLFADLRINPGTYGCQSFEATDFLIHHRQWDVTSELILWQVGIIGVLDRPKDDFDNSRGAKVLQERLLEHYPAEHEIVLYEAAQYPEHNEIVHPKSKPKIAKIALKNLADAKFSRISTLYIPPARRAKCDSKVLESLGVDINNLK